MEIKKQLSDGTVYRIYGEGPTCVLLHGFAEDGHIWDQQVAVLMKEFSCMVIDMPGTGDSASSFEKYKDLSVESAADLVLKIIDQEHLGKVTLLGHSMGGYITLAFAEKYSERLNGFGLIHSTAFADSEEKVQNRKKSATFMKEHGTRLFLEQLYPNLYGELFKKEHYDIIEMQIKASEIYQAEVLIQYYEMMMVRPDRTNVLRASQKPVLFIIGAEDKTVNLSDSMAQCHLPQESHIHILEKAGHMGMKEEAEKTTIAIREFLSYVNGN
jgi:pimeloyl-ACP methyl ester carboxylesterase